MRAVVSGEEMAERAADAKRPRSSPAGGEAAAAAGKKFSDDSSVAALMPLYYGRLFPWQALYRWLAYGHDEPQAQAGKAADAGFFKRRELCFTLEGDIFVRYQSFADGAAMARAIRQQQPSKIDIGPVFNVDPQRRNAYNSSTGGPKTFMPVERELVFDIDLTDYDDVRTCCSGGSICARCWPYMTVAVKIIDAGLREDFGFKHILWVYSGRRGVHCWVCDERARTLTNEGRTAVAEYFSVYKGVERNRPRVNVSFPLSPSLQRASAVLREAWVAQVLPGQALLEDGGEHLERIVGMIGDEEVQETLLQRFRRRSGGGGEEDLSVSRWREIEKEVMKAARKRPLLRKCLDEIVFAYSYPRLDIEVSKHRNHLLKAPFCIHPKTGRVCVPVDPAAADEFDPMAVPTLARMLNELEEYAEREEKGGGDRKLEDWKKTSMADAVSTFERTFLDGMTAACRERMRERAREAKAQPTLAW